MGGERGGGGEVGVAPSADVASGAEWQVLVGSGLYHLAAKRGTACNKCYEVWVLNNVIFVSQLVDAGSGSLNRVENWGDGEILTIVLADHYSLTLVDR